MAKEKADETESGFPPVRPQIVPSNRMIDSKMVRVRVTSQTPLCEGQIYQPGDEFETTAERAASIAHHVQIVNK